MKCAACEYEYRDGKTQLEKNLGPFCELKTKTGGAFTLREDALGPIRTLYVCPSCGTVRAE
jgi:hypothetical protein